MNIRIAIVEDSLSISHNWIQIINTQPSFTLAGTFHRGDEALQGLPALQPDVVLMDISLPGISGIECVAHLKSRLPRTAFLMVTVHSDNDNLFRAFQAGATGYLLKRSTAAELVGAIFDVLNGGAPMTGEIARRVIESFSRPAPTAAENCVLSEREKEVIELLAQGYSDKEIALRLDIKFATVRSHVAKIFEKLHVRSRVEAATWFLRTPASLAPLPPG
ncbi:MAG TPA: response regulator transcription factor [Verrucomicrobiae bacterium]